MFVVWPEQPVFFRRDMLQTFHKNREYSESLPHFLSVSGLENRFGEKKCWHNDVSNMEGTRRIYHQLLPTYVNTYKKEYNVEELAQMASNARTSAKLYTRDISPSYIRWWSAFYDGFRHWKTYGKWSSKGMSYDEIWKKYETQVLRSLSQKNITLTPEMVRRCTAELILQKACTTNTKIDRLCHVENCKIK